MNNYLKQKGISATDFALEIGCSAGTIYRLMKMGSVTPEIFDKIKKATGGLVTRQQTGMEGTAQAHRGHVSQVGVP